MKHLFIFAISALLSTATFAARNGVKDDIENCRWRTGEPMTQKVCDQFRAEAERDRQVAEQQRQSLEQQNQARAEREAQKQAEKERAEQDAKVRRAEMAQEEERNRRYREELAREEEREEAAMKRKCGKDYGQLRTGMTLDRYKECNGAPAYVTDTVGADGRIETWRSTFYWIRVKNGRIVSYTRRTN